MKKKKISNMGYLLKLAGNQTKYLLLSAIFSVLGSICTFIPFVMVYNVFLFLFSGNGDTSIAIQYGIISGIAIIAKYVLRITSGTFSHLGAFNTLYNVRLAISKHIPRVNLGFFTNNTSGEIKKVIIEDVERLEKFLAHQIPDITSAICTPIIVFIYLLTLNVPMALGMLTPVIIGLAIQLVAMRLTGKQMPTYHRLTGKLNSTIMQFINGMPIMKTFNMTAKGYKEYSNTITEYHTFWKKSSRDQGYTFGIFVTLVESGILFVLPLGGYLYLKHHLPVNIYLFFMIMSMVFLSSLLNLKNFAQMFTQIMSGIDRIRQILDLEVITESDELLEKNVTHALFFENVSFRYGQSDVLKNVNISIKPGSLTAFVGASGAGKTTAAQLIPKFWEVSKGRICVDDKNINNLRNENLMDLVSFVFQETFMLNDSIYQNIAIGNKHAIKEHVENAAKAAQIHDFIVGLPNGYDTILGEDGIKLSGGERQRICIARAILKDAPIIIFDEATSYTDIENEHKIQLALEHLLKGKTTIMIAHRLHTIVGADQICVYNQGEVIEIGTHNELLQKGGLYKKMWQTYTGILQEEVL